MGQAALTTQPRWSCSAPRGRRAPRDSDSDGDCVQHLDLTSQFILPRDFGLTPVERGRRKIIFTASLPSFQGGINVADYGPAESCLAGLSRSLADEWASRGVGVDGFVPVAADNTRRCRNDPVRSAASLDRMSAG